MSEGVGPVAPLRRPRTKTYKLALGNTPDLILGCAPIQSTRPMVVRALRAALFASILLAVWSFARPARAASLAPFCDDRGATAIASPPALEAPDEAVRRAAAPSCDPDGPLFGLAFDHGRAHGAKASPEQEPAIAAVPVAIAHPTGEPIAFVTRETSSPYGVRYRVERPPRV